MHQLYCDAIGGLCILTGLSCVSYQHVCSSQEVLFHPYACCKKMVPSTHAAQIAVTVLQILPIEPKARRKCDPRTPSAVAMTQVSRLVLETP